MDRTGPGGLLGEHEFYKTVLLGSGWTIEPYRPDRDVEGIDYWMHLPGQPFNLLAWQVKTTFQLLVHYRTRIAHWRVEAKIESLFTHPRLWYIFGYFDEAIRAFSDPVFVVPSTYLHTRAKAHGKGHVRMDVDANMEPGSRDQWVPYRTSVHGIGRRIEEIFRNLPSETPEQRLAFERRTGLRLSS